jgi:hypothetical protein
VWDMWCLTELRAIPAGREDFAVLVFLLHAGGCSVNRVNAASNSGALGSAI